MRGSLIRHQYQEQIGGKGRKKRKDVKVKNMPLVYGGIKSIGVSKELNKQRREAKYN